jgi:endonuclease/exonuclease/phosphatase (EEP) superfamily protein YafD
MVDTVHIVLTGLGVLVVLATGLSLVRGGHWWARLFDFPRQQTAALGIAVLVGLFADGRGSGVAAYALAGALALGIGYQAWCILPYTPLWRRQVLPAERPDPARRLSLLIANVLMENRNADGLLAIVRDKDPDLVLTMETDDFWAGKLAVLDDAYPFGLKHPLGNTYGMMLFSRLELRDAGFRFLLEDGVPSIRARIVLRSGRHAIPFYGVHPRPPSLLQDSSSRDAEILLVAKEIRELGVGRGRGRPVIVAGDLNDVAWSHTTRLFQRIGGLLDPRIGRGLYSSFHAKYPFLRWPLDHVFFDDDFRLVRLERLPGFGSDHFPILIELSYEPAGADEHEAPEMEDGDGEEARERIREGRKQAEEGDHWI